MLETGLRPLGVGCESSPDGLTVHGPVRLRAAHLDAAGDHRFAMAWAIAAALVPPGGGDTVIEGAEAAAVSYPGFFADLAPLLGLLSCQRSKAEDQVWAVAGLDDLEPAHRDGDREHVGSFDVRLRTRGMVDEAPGHLDALRRGPRRPRRCPPPWIHRDALPGEHMNATRGSSASSRCRREPPLVAISSRIPVAVRSGAKKTPATCGPAGLVVARAIVSYARSAQSARSEPAASSGPGGGAHRSRRLMRGPQGHVRPSGIGGQY